MQPQQPVPPPSDADQPARPPRTRSNGVWIVAGVVAVVLLGGSAAIAYGLLRTDPGVRACEAIRDSDMSTPDSGGSEDDFTEAEYKEIRGQFADSGKKDIREHGTKLVDLMWQAQQMGDDAGLGALALLGPLMQHLTGLQSACADAGVVFNLPKLGPDPEASEPVSPDVFGEDATGAPVPTEGSAATSTSFAWPDGVAVQLNRVEVVDRRLGYEIPKSESLVRVRFTYRNTTSEPIPIEAMSSWVTVLYGPNRTEAESEAGYSTEDKAEQLSNQDEPTRIAAGGSVTMWRTYSVPNDELTALAVRVDKPEVPGTTGLPEPYTFADVEKILKR